MPPPSLEDLNHAELLLLLAWRRSPPDGGPRPCADTVWRRGCGDELGQRTASVFATVLCCLERGARRPLSTQPPEQAALGAHERAVLELVAACQCGALALAGALARWLVRAPEHMPLLAAAAALARLMEQAGLSLRAPHEFRTDRDPPLAPPGPPLAGVARRS